MTVITDGRFDVANDDLPDKSQLSRKKVFVILTYHMQRRQISKAEFNRQYLPKIKAMFSGDERFIIFFKDSHDTLEKFVEGGVGNKTHYPDCILGSRLTDCFFDEKSRCLQINLTFIKQQPHADHGDPCPKLNNENVFCDLKMCQRSPAKSTAFSTNALSNSKGKNTAASVKGTSIGKTAAILIKGTSQSMGKNTMVSATETSIPTMTSLAASVKQTLVRKSTAIPVNGTSSSAAKSVAVSDKGASIAQEKITATSVKGTSGSTENTVKGASKGKMTAVSVTETSFSTGMSAKRTSTGKVAATSVNGTSSSVTKDTAIPVKGILAGKSEVVWVKRTSVPKGKIATTSVKRTSGSTGNIVEETSTGKMAAVSVKEASSGSAGKSVERTSIRMVAVISVKGTSNSTGKSTSVSVKETSSFANVTASSVEIPASSENDAVFFVEKSSNQTRILIKSNQVTLQEKMSKMDAFSVPTTSVKPESRRAKIPQKTKASEIGEFDNDKKGPRYLTNATIKTALTDNISQPTGKNHVRGKVHSTKPEAPKAVMPATEPKWTDGVAIWVVNSVATLIVLVVLIMILVFWQHRSKTKKVVIAREKEDAIGPSVRISEKTRSVEVDINSDGSTNSRSRLSEQNGKFSKSFVQKSVRKSSVPTNGSFKRAVSKSNKSAQAANQDEEGVE